MPLNAKKGVLDGATTTVNLPAGFALKAIIFWTTQATAESDIDGHGLMSMGFATNDGGSIQQGYQAYADSDAVGTSVVRGAINTTAALRGFVDGGGTVDFEMDVTAFGSESFTVTWTDPPTSTIKVHYLALGGSAISAARVFNFTTSLSVATQDVTIATGFGQPDLLFFLTNGGVAALTDGTNGAALSLGVASSSTSRRFHGLYTNHNITLMAQAAWQGDRAVVGHTDGTTRYVADLSARADWPTDGFELSYITQAATTSRPIIGLALKGDLVATIGGSTVPTAAAPQTQDFAAGGTPKAALLWGTTVPTVGSLDTSHAELGGLWLGGLDTTDEGSGGVWQDDNNTESFAARFHSESKAAHIITGIAGPPAVQSEADAALDADSLALTWNNTDSVARAFSYLILADIPVIEPSGIPSAEAFGTPSIEPYTIAPGSIPSAEAFGTPSLEGGISTISPQGIPSAEEVGTPSVVLGIDVGSGIPSAEAFGTLSLLSTIKAGGISSAERFGRPAIYGPTDDTITIGQGIPSAEAFGTPAIYGYAHAAPPPQFPDVFLDPTTAEAFAWPVSHLEEEAVTFGGPVSHGAPTAGVSIVRHQANDDPYMLIFRGTVLSKLHADAIEDYFDRCKDRTIIFQHALREEYEVVVTGFDIKHERVGWNSVIQSNHIWRATIEMLVVEVRSSTLIAWLG